jgi:hypothetical protein
MFVDYVLNGESHGEVGEQLNSCRYDPGLLRPYIDKDGRKYVTANVGTDPSGKIIYKKRLVSDLVSNGVNIPVANATSLRKEEWIELDRQVLRCARERLRAWTDLSAASSFGGFNAMSKMILEHETMSDPGEAIVDMDALTPGRTDAPKFQLEGLPLPITHSDFWYSSRRLAVSRNTGTPLDTTMGEAAGRRVAEQIEKTLIGTIAGATYGVAASYSNAPTVFGYATHPDRLLKTDVTTPDGTNGATTVTDVLAMIAQAAAAHYYGPFMLYHSTDWDKWLDDDYRATDSRTLRQRLRQIDSIVDVRRLDFLTNTYTFLMVQMTSDVARAINGMDITTVQWETSGGMRVNFKVMAIMVPQIRSDFNGNTGIVHATTA